VGYCAYNFRFLEFSLVNDKFLQMISQMTVWNITLAVSIIGLGFAVMKLKQYLVDEQNTESCVDDCLTIPAAELYNDDQLTEEEYKKIKAKMALRLKEQAAEQLRVKQSSAEKLAELKEIIQNHARNKALQNSNTEAIGIETNIPKSDKEVHKDKESMTNYSTETPETMV
jgi:hypothetical protein